MLLLARVATIASLQETTVLLCRFDQMFNYVKEGVRPTLCIFTGKNYIMQFACGTKHGKQVHWLLLK